MSGDFNPDEVIAKIRQVIWSISQTQIGFEKNEAPITAPIIKKLLVLMLRI
jgi:hypothetical protein